MQMRMLMLIKEMRRGRSKSGDGGEVNNHVERREGAAFSY